MTCIHLPDAILTISDDSEPFVFRGKRFSVNARRGPFQCDKYGDPVANQPAEPVLQAAYEHWKNLETKP